MVNEQKPAISLRTEEAAETWVIHIMIILVSAEGSQTVITFDYCLTLISHQIHILPSVLHTATRFIFLNILPGSLPHTSFSVAPCNLPSRVLSLATEGLPQPCLLSRSLLSIPYPSPAATFHSGESGHWLSPKQSGNALSPSWIWPYCSHYLDPGFSFLSTPPNPAFSFSISLAHSLSRSVSQSQIFPNGIAYFFAARFKAQQPSPLVSSGGEGQNMDHTTQTQLLSCSLQHHLGRPVKMQ